MKKSFLIVGLIAAFVIAAAVNFYPQNNYAPKGERVRGKMFEKLNLTDAQKDKIEQLRLKNQEEMIDLRADMQKKRLAIKELKLKGNYSRADYINLVKDLNASRDKISTARANHRMDVYEMLTDQQKEIFNRMPMMEGRHGKGRCMMDGHRMMDGRGPHDGSGQRPMRQQQAPDKQ